MHASALGAGFEKGEVLSLVPIQRLEALKDALDRFRDGAALNGFQNWILDGLYDFDPPGDFRAASIIVVALPHPFFSTVEMEHRGKVYRAMSLVASDFASTERCLRAALPRGRLIAPAQKLPLKRLAAMSGLAHYGRNNICYIEGMGSNFSLAAYYSDLPCGEGIWTEPRLAPMCEGCSLCLAACPTGAIRAGSFLIDTEKCLSFLNESATPFPAWLPPAVHHSLYDCLKCQRTCPMNVSEVGKRGLLIRFDETETELLLSGRWLEHCTPAFAEKARYLGLQQWPEGIAKNLRAIIEANCAAID